jgi:hypothetical protein
MKFTFRLTLLTILLLLIGTTVLTVGVVWYFQARLNAPGVGRVSHQAAK